HGTEGTRRGDSQEIPSAAEGAGRTAAAALGGDGSASVAAWRDVAGRASHGPVPEHDPCGEASLEGGRIRRTGGGRRPLTDPQLFQGLAALVGPTTRGDPESPLRWTCKSTRKQ